MATRSYMSIGEVLVMLKTEFRDVTISKIRFLEGEGLIDPERTPSGYRKFYDKDIERLRTILRMQRDEYLPLKVIKDRLENKEEDGAAKPALAPVEEEIATPPTGLHMSEEELAVATGVDKNRIRELESFGLLRAHGLEPITLQTVGSSLGCNQYLFTRRAGAPARCGSRHGTPGPFRRAH